MSSLLTELFRGVLWPSSKIMLLGFKSTQQMRFSNNPELSFWVRRVRNVNCQKLHDSYLSIKQLCSQFLSLVLSGMEAGPMAQGRSSFTQHKGLPAASGIVVRTAEPWPLVSPPMCTTWHLHSLGRRWQRMSATLSSWVPEQILRLHVSSSDDVVWAPVYQRL